MLIEDAMPVLAAFPSPKGGSNSNVELPAIPPNNEPTPDVSFFFIGMPNSSTCD